MSRIDRFLLFEEWCARWPNCLQVAYLHGLSDHCPLVLSVDVLGYHQFVRSKLQLFQLEGWGGFVLKE
jgi:hypothetical protein